MIKADSNLHSIVVAPRDNGALRVTSLQGGIRVLKNHIRQSYHASGVQIDALMAAWTSCFLKPGALPRQVDRLASSNCRSKVSYVNTRNRAKIRSAEDSK